MTIGNAKSIASRVEQMRELVDAARQLHPHYTMTLLAKTLGAPIDTVRAVLYRDLIVSHATIERWSRALEEGADRDAAVAAARHASVRRVVQRVREMANATPRSLTGSDPDETGGATV
jgi:hypothetical protein